MHTTTGEVKGVCQMVYGGTGSIPVYDISRLSQVATYEVHVNNRFPELQVFAPGKSTAKNC